MDPATVRSRVDEVWEHEIVPTLVDYIRIPNVSPAYDAGWASAGHMDDAVELARVWCAARPIEGLTVEVVTLAGRTPVLLCEVPATGDIDRDDTVVLYGHLDKQPPMHGWREGFGPWEPVIDDGRLYGRGGADDGYACFAALTAIEALRRAGGSHARCVLLVECSEESGSPDLPAHLEQLGDRLGTPSLVVCLDSGCADYERPLDHHLPAGQRHRHAAGRRADRGRALGDGRRRGALVVPRAAPPPRSRRGPPTRAGCCCLSSTSRSPTSDGGASRPRRPSWRRSWCSRTPGPPGRRSTTRSRCCWPRPGSPRCRSRAWTGCPRPRRPATCSSRSRPRRSRCDLPPGVDPDAAGRALTDALEADPPHGASVRFEVHDAAAGWDAPPTAPWLADALETASRAEFGKAAGTMGEGGTIPFMEMLGRRFPAAQFMITGVLGPGNNAHGPNEALHLQTGRRVTAAVAHVLDAHAHK